MFLYTCTYLVHFHGIFGIIAILLPLSFCVFFFHLEFLQSLLWEWSWSDRKGQVLSRKESWLTFWLLQHVRKRSVSLNLQLGLWQYISHQGGVNNTRILKACLGILPCHPNSLSAVRSKILTGIIVGVFFLFVCFFYFNQSGNGMASLTLLKVRKEKEAMKSLSFSYVWRTHGC